MIWNLFPRYCATCGVAFKARKDEAPEHCLEHAAPLIEASRRKREVMAWASQNVERVQRTMLFELDQAQQANDRARAAYLSNGSANPMSNAATQGQSSGSALGAEYGSAFGWALGNACGMNRL